MIDKEQAVQKGIKILDSTKEINPLFEMLQTHFPESIREGQVSLKAIATYLGKDLSNAQGYELTFTGKALANALYTTTCDKALKLEQVIDPNYDDGQDSSSRDEDRNMQDFRDKNEALQGEARGLPQGVIIEAKTQQSSFLTKKSNTIIIGDNLDALKVLKSAYSEKIKMIYIDPPYNTGNDDFIYPDNFRADYKEILREVGLIEIDEEGREVESETLQFFKNIQSTKTHSSWLSFMLPRLKLARDLLREDGVIFISIDDNEQANLKLLCDEIFGEENFVANAFVLDNLKGRSNANLISNVGHNILIYAKKICYLNENGGFNEIENLFGGKIENKFKDEDGIGSYTLNAFCKTGQGRFREERPTMYYPILYKENGFFAIKENEFKKIYNKTSKTFDDDFIEYLKMKYESLGFEVILPTNKKGEKLRWTSSFKGFINLINNKDLIYNKTSIMQKKRPDIGEMLQIYANGIPKSFMYEPKYANGADDLDAIFNKKVFDYPKSVTLLKHLLKISTTPIQNDLILDFFAGSGTTAQAVMELNSEDNGNRQFILVQIDEPINKEKSKVAYDFCKNELKSKNPTISDITIERVKRAAKKIKANTCFNVFTLESKPKLISNEKGALKLITNTNLSAFDKAINLALSAGKSLDKELESIIEGKLYKCEDSYFCIELDKQVLETLAKTNDEYIYLDGFIDADLEHFLNLDTRFKDRLNVVY